MLSRPRPRLRLPTSRHALAPRPSSWEAPTHVPVAKPRRPEKAHGRGLSLDGMRQYAEPHESREVRVPAESCNLVHGLFRVPNPHDPARPQADCPYKEGTPPIKVLWHALVVLVRRVWEPSRRAEAHPLLFLRVPNDVAERLQMPLQPVRRVHLDMGCAI